MCQTLTQIYAARLNQSVVLSYKKSKMVAPRVKRSVIPDKEWKELMKELKTVMK